MLDSIALFESPQQWIIVLVIVLLLFGGSRIPEIMRGLGSGMKEFKKGMKEDDTPDRDEQSDRKGSGDKEAASKP